MREIHLVCNAHLDPVWLWQWEEGAAEALSTFRIAADFCERYEGYVFNHNEAVLYEWIEEYDPRLFERIQSLVRAGSWQIMGGWYLQPDCNLPSGESITRHALYGRRYFAEKFGARPTTAINFDPFGHSRGIVQILAKSGYDSYVFCRPHAHDLSLPAEEFTWVGFDGSSVVGHRAYGHYETHRGQATTKIREYLDSGMEHPIGMLLWGIGNHGGGASREDLEAITDLQRELRESGMARVVHSSLPAYFKARQPIAALPEHRDHLNPWAPGCYTSQIRIKQFHRKLEDLLYSTEKMASQATLRGALEYPVVEFLDAQKDLMFSQFHDILPGSSIPAVEEASLMRLGRGVETVSRIRARVLFALSRGEPEPAEGDIPIFIYNPHPFPITDDFEVEFQPSQQNRDGTFTSYQVVLKTGEAAGSKGRHGLPVAVQFEKEASSVGVDWRKRMVFRATLPPASLSRLDCTPESIPERPRPTTVPDANGRITIVRDEYVVSVDTESGLISSYRRGNTEFLADPGPVAYVLADSDDAWETQRREFRNVIGAFRLASPEESAEICGVRKPRLDPVRVIEDGPVRSVVEAIFVYGRSQLVLTYELPVAGAQIGVRARVFWAEKRSMLKLALPLSGAVSPERDGALMGQTAFGTQPLATNGEEGVAQRWVAALGEGNRYALTVINNGTYGVSLEGSELRLTLLRSPAYSGLPVGEDEPPIPQDRFTPRIDQGERLFRFWFQGGDGQERIERVDREATARGEEPMPLMLYPSPLENGSRAGSPAREPAVTLSDDVVQLAAFKRAEDDSGYVLRLFEPTGAPRETEVALPPLGIRTHVSLRGYELITLLVTDEGEVLRVNLMEEQ
jgi:alpha-mannosidase